MNLILFLYFCFFSAFVVIIIFNIIRLFHANPRETIVNEFDYLLAKIERYTAINSGGLIDSGVLKRIHNIPFNFSYFLDSEQMIYLFDRDKKIFAVYDKSHNKTYLCNLKQMQNIIRDYENQLPKHITSGGVVTLPHRFLHY